MTESSALEFDRVDTEEFDQRKGLQSSCLENNYKTPQQELMYSFNKEKKLKKIKFIDKLAMSRDQKKIKDAYFSSLRDI